MMSSTPKLALSTTPAMIAAATPARGRFPVSAFTSAKGTNPGSSARRWSALVVPRTRSRSPTRNEISASLSCTVTPCCCRAITVAS